MIEIEVSAPFQFTCHVWDSNVLVRAPGLEPKSGGEEPFSLLRELSLQCLNDMRRGRTATARQLLSLLAGVGE
mgnify:CR=1 FL=1